MHTGKSLVIMAMANNRTSLSSLTHSKLKEELVTTDDGCATIFFSYTEPLSSLRPLHQFPTEFVHHQEVIISFIYLSVYLFALVKVVIMNQGHTFGLKHKGKCRSQRTCLHKPDTWQCLSGYERLCVYVCWEQRRYTGRENILVTRVLEKNMGSTSVTIIWKLLNPNATLQWRCSGQRDLGIDIYSQRNLTKQPPAFLYYWM